MHMEKDWRIVTDGLAFPEGPVAMEDGAVLVVEIKARQITRVATDGQKNVVARLPGAPNGAAFGPDGALYVCNNGDGFLWGDPGGIVQPVGGSATYCGGSIDRVNIETGACTTLYRSVNGRPLLMPNDIVFDLHGGFYFTDHGMREERGVRHGGVYYGKADGSHVAEIVFPISTANGVGLSPDQKRLYVAETETGRLYAFDILAPGKVEPLRHDAPGACILAQIEGFKRYDSLAVEANGNICVAGLTPGCITVISPEGKQVAVLDMPDPFPTNICFGGADMRTAYITLSGTGRLLQVPWPRPGLRLNYQRF